ncbi:MAG: hypothetical protein ACI83N_000720 [Hydrogenophaga sp.]|jgi:hypothetical protein
MSSILPALASPLSRRHKQRLREVYRSAGWPSADPLEVDLLAAGLLERRCSTEGHETLRLTDAGIQALAQAHAGNRAARSPHEALVERVAENLGHSGRLAWRGLTLRVPLPNAPNAGSASPTPGASDPGAPGNLFDEDAVPAPDHRWCVAMPDVFSIRRSSVEAYLEPVVHEIKVSRADLLGDLKRPAKRAAYLAMAGACWYVLGVDAKGRPIAQPQEVPPECGVLQVEGTALVVAREAPRRAVQQLPFHVWMSLAQAGPAVRPEGDAQAGL